jgi:hypothetical protein
LLAAASRFAFGPLLFISVCVAACGGLDPQTGAFAATCVDADSNPSVPVSFAATIRPWMDRSATDPRAHGCKACHYPSAPDPQGIQIGGLDLSTLSSLRRGGVTSGTNIVIPGKPCESVLVQKLRVQTVSDWIAEGAQGADDD